MLVNQLAIFLENRKGRLAKLTEVLTENKIDLVSLSIADTSDFGIVRTITSNNKKAKRVLKEAGFTVTNCNLIGIEVDNKPGGLNRVLENIDECDIAIEYLYSFSHTKEGKAIILIKVNDTEKALEVLQLNNEVVLLSEI